MFNITTNRQKILPNVSINNNRNESQIKQQQLLLHEYCHFCDLMAVVHKRTDKKELNPKMVKG